MPNATDLDALLAGVSHAAKDLADRERDLARLAILKMRTEAEMVAGFLEPGVVNPQNGKAHSMTSAQQAASDSAPIMDLRRERADLEHACTMSRAAYEISRLRAWHAAKVADVLEIAEHA